MKRPILLLAISFAALCFNAAPAQADLLNFAVNNLDMNYNGTNFTATVNPASGSISLARGIAPGGSTSINPPFLMGGNFSITMAITGIGANTANGNGSFALTDFNGDTINAAAVSGQWTRGGPGAPHIFNGSLSNVTWSNPSADTTFDGDPLAPPAVSMLFPTAPPPWHGGISQLTAIGAPWFASGAWAQPVTGGNVITNVVPVPAAVLLGMLGLSVASVKLRKFA